MRSSTQHQRTWAIAVPVRSVERKAPCGPEVAFAHRCVAAESRWEVHTRPPAGEDMNEFLYQRQIRIPADTRQRARLDNRARIRVPRLRSQYRARCAGGASRPRGD